MLNNNSIEVYDVAISDASAATKRGNSTETDSKDSMGYSKIYSLTLPVKIKFIKYPKVFLFIFSTYLQ